MVKNTDKKVLICFGTRPETIKFAPVIQELKKRKCNYCICVTGQHREMLDQMLRTFNITPDYDLKLMQENQSLNSLCASIFNCIDEIFDMENPDIVLVQGDTTTSNIIAQAAFHRKIDVGHIEAGLRTYNRYSPFPEEINRQIISRIAKWHFTPTSIATQNLLKEGGLKDQIIETGNTVIDALKIIQSELNNFNIKEHFKLDLENFDNLILVTGHRRENFGSGLIQLCEALRELARNSRTLIYFPVHLNPKVKDIVEVELEGKSNIILGKPVGYIEMLTLIANCNLIITDSGGIQEEAPSFGKPVIVTRKETERMEAVKAGYSYLVGPDSNKIIQLATEILRNPPSFENKPNPFGDGNASKRIVDALLKAEEKI